MKKGKGLNGTQKARKEIREAEDAVFKAAKNCKKGKQDCFVKAERDLEKAEAELDDSEEENQ